VVGVFFVVGKELPSKVKPHSGGGMHIFPVQSTSIDECEYCQKPTPYSGSEMILLLVL